MPWVRRQAGFYDLAGTRYAVGSMNADGVDGEFISRVVWAVIRFSDSDTRDTQSGENLDWFDTMREAKAEAERLARNV